MRAVLRKGRNHGHILLGSWSLFVMPFAMVTLLLPAEGLALTALHDRISSPTAVRARPCADSHALVYVALIEDPLIVPFEDFLTRFIV